MTGDELDALVRRITTLSVPDKLRVVIALIERGGKLDLALAVLEQAHVALQLLAETEEAGT